MARVEDCFGVVDENEVASRGTIDGVVFVRSNGVRKVAGPINEDF